MGWICNPRTMMILKWVVLLAVLLVAASCGGPDGMYQGGGDDTPSWR
jgi:hypothetical protein